jgi:O-antigen/teichoic acid export membrane protein
MSYAKKMLEGTFVVFIITLAASVIGYILRIYLARNLSVSDFGLFYAVLAFMSIFLMFKDFGIGTALARYIPEFLVMKRFMKIKSSVSSVVVVQWIIGLALGVPLLVFSEQIADHVFHTQQAALIIQILSMELILCSTILRPVLQGLQKMKAYSLVELVRVSLVLFAAFFTISMGISGIALSYVLASIIGQILFLSYIFRITSRMDGGMIIKFDRRLYSFGLLVFIGGLAGFFVSYADTIILTIFRSTEEVGLYQVALPTSQLLLIFSNSMMVVLLPVISEIWSRGQKSYLSDAMQLLVKFSFVFMIPFVLIMLAFPELVISVIFGSQYMAAAPALQLLSITMLFYMMILICSTVLTAMNKPRLNTKLIIYIAVVNVVLNLILVPVFSITGAAAAAVISNVFGFLLLAMYVHKFVEFRMPWASLAKAFATGVGALGLVCALKEVIVLDVLLEALVCVAAAFAFYIVVILLTRTIVRKDLMIFGDSGIGKILRVFMRFMRD